MNLKWSLEAYSDIRPDTNLLRAHQCITNTSRRQEVKIAGYFVVCYTDYLDYNF